MTATDLLQSALADIDRALSRLSHYALNTDNPEHGAIEAANHLDAAREALAGAA